MGGVLNFITIGEVDDKFYLDLLVSNLNFNDYKTYKINEISNNPNKTFFYIRYSFTWIEFEIKNNNGRLPLQEEIINSLIKYSNFKVILMSDNECDSPHLIESLRNACKIHGISEKQLIVITLNEKLHDLKGDSEITVHVGDKCKSVMIFEMSRFIHNYKPVRDNLFMSYNRAPKNHRFVLLSYLKKYDILDDTDWTWLRGNEFINNFTVDSGYSEHYFKTILKDSDLDNLKDSMEFIKNIKRKTSKYEEGYEIDVPPFFLDWGESFKIGAFQNSYINIVGETEFQNKDMVVISEKSMIPLYFYQIPIFLASPNHIKFFRKYCDLDFFDDIIDHSYDYEFDNRKRILMVVNEILRLHSKKNEIKKFFLENQNRFEENRKKILKFADRHLDYNFFKSLID